MKAETMTNEELANHMPYSNDLTPRPLSQQSEFEMLWREAARRLRATPTPCVESPTATTKVEVTPVEIPEEFKIAMSEIARGDTMPLDEALATPASISQGAGTEWRWLNDGETMRAGDVYSDDNPVGFRGADFNGIGSKWRNGCDLEVRRLRTVDISHGIVGKLYFTNRHFPHPLAGGELREVACFCEGVFSIIEAAPTSFSMGGVKEARRRIAAALTKGPVSP